MIGVEIVSTRKNREKTLSATRIDLMKTLVMTFFVLEAIATFRLYRIRSLVGRRFNENYKTIGYATTDRAYMDAFKTMVAIPFRMVTHGLPTGIVVELKVLRVYRIVAFCVLASLFIRLLGK